MKLPGSTIPALVISLFVQTSLAGIDCGAEAEGLFERGRQADEQSRLEDARALYTRAAQRCGRWEYWMAVGDIWADDFLGDSIEAVNEEGRPAIEAYNSAFEAARRDRNKVEGAAAARAMVELGLRAGDPTRANRWLLLAQDLDPANPELAALQQEVDFARDALSTVEIETGLSETRGLGRVSSILMATTSSAYWNSYTEPVEPQGGGGVTGPADASRDEVGGRSDGVETGDAAGNTGKRRSIDMPINFEMDSTHTTAQTASNVVNLARVLAERPGQESILLVGHADARGDADYNMWLSRRRADAIRLEIEALQPTLVGRISTDGRGELEPIDSGNDERAYANNRRLEVIVRD